MRNCCPLPEGNAIRHRSQTAFHMSVALGLVSAFLIASTACGQLTLMSAQRSVWASQGGLFPPAQETRQTSDFGFWEDAALLQYAAARQTSDIRSDGIDFISRTYASGGAGHHSSSRSQLNVVFDVGSPVSWSVAYEWQQRPGADSSSLFLRRAGSSDNLFAAADWLNGQNPRLVGTLDTGRYELQFVDAHYDSGFAFHEHFSFVVTAPTPSTLAILLGIPSMMRRGRR